MRKKTAEHKLPITVDIMFLVVGTLIGYLFSQAAFSITGFSVGDVIESELNLSEPELPHSDIISDPVADDSIITDSVISKTISLNDSLDRVPLQPEPSLVPEMSIPQTPVPEMISKSMSYSEMGSSDTYGILGGSESSSLDGWSMFRRDLNHSAYYPAVWNLSGFGYLWNYTIGQGVLSSPVVAADILYFGCFDHNFYAVNASDGSHIWNYSTGSTIISTAAVADNIVYFGSDDQYLYALNATNGSQIWNYSAAESILSSPAVSDDIIYFGSVDDHLYALNATNGTQIWNYSAGDNISSSVAIVNDMLYFGCFDHYLYALNATTGSQLWNYSTGDSIFSSPSVVNDIAYFGSMDDSFYALNATNGSQIWNVSTGNDIVSSPAYYSDTQGAIVIFGSLDAKVYGVNATNGRYLWNYTTGDIVRSSPAVTKDGLIFIGSQDNYLYVLQARSPGTHGAMVQRFNTGGDVQTSPAVTNNTVYIANSVITSHVFALRNGLTTCTYSGSGSWVLTGNEYINCSNEPNLGIAGNLYLYDNSTLYLNNSILTLADMFGYVPQVGLYDNATLRLDDSSLYMTEVLTYENSHLTANRSKIIRANYTPTYWTYFIFDDNSVNVFQDSILTYTSMPEWVYLQGNSNNTFINSNISSLQVIITENSTNTFQNSRYLTDQSGPGYPHYIFGDSRSYFINSPAIFPLTGLGPSIYGNSYVELQNCSFSGLNIFENATVIINGSNSSIGCPIRTSGFSNTSIINSSIAMFGIESDGDKDLKIINYSYGFIPYFTVDSDPRYRVKIINSTIQKTRLAASYQSKLYVNNSNISLFVLYSNYNGNTLYFDGWISDIRDNGIYYSVPVGFYGEFIDTNTSNMLLYLSSNTTNFISNSRSMISITASNSTDIFTNVTSSDLTPLSTCSLDTKSGIDLYYSSRAYMNNVTASHLYVRNLANVTVNASDIASLHPRGGIINFSALSIVRDLDLDTVDTSSILYGAVDMPAKYTRFLAGVTFRRFYPLFVRYLNSATGIPNVLVEIRNISNNFQFGNWTTDSQGYAAVNLTWTNYTSPDTYQIWINGSSKLVGNINITKDTPIIIYDTPCHWPASGSWVIDDSQYVYCDNVNITILGNIEIKDRATLHLNNSNLTSTGDFLRVMNNATLITSRTKIVGYEFDSADNSTWNATLSVLNMDIIRLSGNSTNNIKDSVMTMIFFLVYGQSRNYFYNQTWNSIANAGMAFYENSSSSVHNSTFSGSYFEAYGTSIIFINSSALSTFYLSISGDTGVTFLNSTLAHHTVLVNSNKTVWMSGLSTGLIGNSVNSTTHFHVNDSMSRLNEYVVLLNTPSRSYINSSNITVLRIYSSNNDNLSLDGLRTYGSTNASFESKVTGFSSNITNLNASKIVIHTVGNSTNYIMNSYLSNIWSEGTSKVYLLNSNVTAMPGYSSWPYTDYGWQGGVIKLFDSSVFSMQNSTVRVLNMFSLSNATFNRSRILSTITLEGSNTLLFMDPLSNLSSVTDFRIGDGADNITVYGYVDMPSRINVFNESAVLNRYYPVYAVNAAGMALPNPVISVKNGLGVIATWIGDVNGFANINLTWNVSNYNDTYTISLNSVDLDWINLTKDTPINISFSDSSPWWFDNQTDIVSAYSPADYSFFNISWQDDFGISNVTFESNFTGAKVNYTIINLSGYVYNFSAILPAGYFYWKSYANDTRNQGNVTDIWFLNVSQVLSSCSLSFNPLGSSSYLAGVNVSCSCTDDAGLSTLWRNGTNVTASELGINVTLKASDYSYICNVTGNENYTAASSGVVYAIAKVASECSLSSSPSGSSSYLVGVNTSCSCTPAAGLSTLWRNVTNVTASELGINVTLKASDYSYICNVTGNENYTAADQALVYTIQRSSHTIHLAINSTESDRSFIYPSGTNASGWLEINQAVSSAALYRNGTNVGTASPASDIALLGAGYYNYTYNYPGSENFTGKNITRFLTISRASPVLTLSSSPGWSVATGVDTNVNCSADLGFINISLYRDGAYINSSVGAVVKDVQSLASGSYVYRCNVSSDQNITGVESSNTLTVGAAPVSSQPSGGGSPNNYIGRSPAVQCVEGWKCTPWSLCVSPGYQTRDCDVTGLCSQRYDNMTKNITYEPKPEIRRNCRIIESCSDGKKNQDESDVDCGGTCPACYVPPPVVEKPLAIPTLSIAVSSPWLFFATGRYGFELQSANTSGDVVSVNYHVAKGSKIISSVSQTDVPSQITSKSIGMSWFVWPGIYTLSVTLQDKSQVAVAQRVFAIIPLWFIILVILMIILLPLMIHSIARYRRRRKIMGSFGIDLKQIKELGKI